MRARRCVSQSVLLSKGKPRGGFYPHCICASTENRRSPPVHEAKSWRRSRAALPLFPAPRVGRSAGRTGVPRASPRICATFRSHDPQPGRLRSRDDLGQGIKSGWAESHRHISAEHLGDLRKQPATAIRSVREVFGVHGRSSTSSGHPYAASSRPMRQPLRRRAAPNVGALLDEVSLPPLPEPSPRMSG